MTGTTVLVTGSTPRQHLCAVAEDHRAGLFAGADQVIEAITGIPPMTVQAFVEVHRAELGG